MEHTALGVLRGIQDGHDLPAGTVPAMYVPESFGRDHVGGASTNVHPAPRHSQNEH